LNGGFILNVAEQITTFGLVAKPMLPIHFRLSKGNRFRNDKM
jgi:hypothetical protein